MKIRSLVKSMVPRSLFARIEPYGHLIEGLVINLMHGFPGRGMKVIGITGTNGKTSTTYMVHRMLQDAGYKTGLMTTVAWGIGNDIHEQQTHYTNVPVPELMKRLKVMRAAKIDYLVMEITSQGLAQHRAFGVPFRIGVLTNITHEHLDYHKTFEKYVAAKRRLFKRVARRGGIGIANADDPNGRYFAETTQHPVLYGVGVGDVQATKVALLSDQVSYTAVAGDDSYDIVCHIPGSFSVSNSLAAVCVGRVLGLTKTQIEQGIAALDGVAGRMTVVDEGQDFSVVVDYAHTPDSFEKLLKDIRPIVSGKLLVMFGSAGRRDEAKRVVQGRLAGEYADMVIITEEDDRDMDGQLIMAEIAAGAVEAGKQQDRDLFLVHNRQEAIRCALTKANKGDTVMLLGKGHEKTIERNGPRAAELRHLQQDDSNPERVVTEPWDEIATVRALLRELQG